MRTGLVKTYDTGGACAHVVFMAFFEDDAVVASDTYEPVQNTTDYLIGAATIKLGRGIP